MVKQHVKNILVTGGAGYIGSHTVRQLAERNYTLINKFAMNKINTYVTCPAMPPLEEFIPYLYKIWDTHIITNNGEYHKKFETALCEYLDVKYISLFCNGTIALLTALRALRISGDVITTPYSFVATAHSLKWNGIKPVFVDIDPATCNLDPEKIEAAITDKTTAIMPVHVYGNPCDVEAIKKIADKHGLKIVYDAAHAFGVKKDGVSVANYGDLSVLSFHATKTFTTFEGGAIVCHDAETKDHIDKLKNFGFEGEAKVIECGINGKMNEFQAVFGLLYLKHIDSYIKRRKAIALKYRDLLQDIDGIHLMNDIDGVEYNYSYFPIFIDEDVYGKSRDSVYEILKDNNIFCRRYFYPLITDFPIYKNESQLNTEALKTAKKVANQVLCLPIYPDLDEYIVDIIVDLIKLK